MPSLNKRINLTVPDSVYDKIQQYKEDNGFPTDASACLQLVIKQLKANETEKEIMDFMRNMPLEAIQKLSSLGVSQIKSDADNTQYPSAMTQLHHIDNLRQTLLTEEYRRKYRNVYVEYIWGDTGVGKTRSVLEKHNYDVYRITDYNHPFDQYAGEDVVLFDEFRSTLPISQMLMYLDVHPLMLPCRYANKVACYTKVYIISNIPLEQQYPNIQLAEPKTWAAWLRRFAFISEMKHEDTTFADIIAEG